MSTERVIIDEKVADEFAAKLAKRVAALPCGNPRKGDFVSARWWASPPSIGCNDS